MGKRLIWIDVAKALAILSVVVGHTYLYGNPLLSFVMSFHIPLFFVWSGYTFNVQKLNKAKLVKRIVFPYISICVFLGILSVIHNGSNGLVSFVLSVVWGSGGTVDSFDIPGIGLAWFLLALYCSKVIFANTEVFFLNFNLNRFLKLLIYIIISYLSFQFTSYLVLPFALSQALVSLPYLCLGQLCREIDFSELKRIKFPVICIALTIWVIGLYKGVFFSIGNLFHVGSLAFGLLMTLSSSFVLLLFFSSLERVFSLSKFFTLISELGKNSLLLLCLHQVESAFINWPTVEFISLDGFSFLVSGVIHLMLVVSMYVLIRLSAPALSRTGL